MDKVSKRDYFNARKKVDAENMIKQAAEGLQEYAGEVYRREALKDSDSGL